MPIVTDKSRKWILTIFMGVLIVAFTLPSYFGQSDQRIDRVVGTVFGEPLKESEVKQAAQEWAMLTEKARIRAGRNPYTGQPIEVPATFQLYMAMHPMLMDVQSLQAISQLVGQISADPRLYALLKRDAARAGITASRDRVESMLVNDVRLPPGTPEPEENAYRAACAEFLAVEAHARQMAAAVKVSRPELQSVIARRLQALTLNLVLFEAEEFRTKVTPPTEQALQALYAAHKDRIAPDTSATNPYGFGYRLNDAVKLEYLTLGRDELARAARAAKPAFDWDVEANMYYLKNKSLYTKEPAPATSPSAFNLNVPPATTQRVQRPFEEVRETIVTDLVQTKAEALRQQVTSRINKLMTADFRAFNDARMKDPKASPASSVGPAINTFEYLKAVAAKVQQETGVLPEVMSFGDRYIDAETLKTDPAMEFARATTPVRGGRLMLGEYVLRRAKPFFESAGGRKDPGAAALEYHEPTPAFEGAPGDARPVVIARVTDARAAMTPPFEQVKDKVLADAVMQAATEAAKAAADAFAAETKSVSLADAATTAKRRYVPVPALTADPNSLPPELMTLSPATREVIIKAAFDLLRSEAGSRSRLAVALPQDRRAAVLELLDARPTVPDMESGRIELAVAYTVQTQGQTEFIVAYFSPDAIRARTEFVDLMPKNEAATQP